MSSHPQGEMSHVDVLIIGAGPAGLMMANWMSRLGVKTRIVDKRGTKIFNGQADGLQCRTLEIFDSFGFGHRAWIESNHMLEICLWNPDPKTGALTRSDRIPDTIPNISRFQQVVLHQGRIERFFLDAIRENSIRTGCNGEKGTPAAEIKVEHGVLPISFSYDASSQDYPLTVELTHLTEEEATPAQKATSKNGEGISDGIFRSNLSADDTADMIALSNHIAGKAGKTETVNAKYILGADGAHSWVRQQLGFRLEGDSTDYIWGVLDIVPITDFPDIRMRCAIHSETSGSVMVIPRENKLVRLYIQLTTTNDSDGTGAKKFDRSSITPEMIIASAQKIMQPYKIEYRYLDWWTAYQIGQRVGDSFSFNERVFLAGDAVHTHSPKAGQGMNVSMQDTYNLGWKVGMVVKGLAQPNILKTYQSERRRIAQDLIDFDHKFSRLFSGRPAKDVMDEEGISMEVFKDAFEKGNMFASGIAVNYGASVIVAKAGSSQEQGDGTEVLGDAKLRVTSREDGPALLQVGMRMHSFKILNQADARPWHLGELLKSNGTWRIVVFPGDIKKYPQQQKRLDALGERLGRSDSFLHRYTPVEQKYDSVFELLSCHCAPRQETTIFDFPEVFRPWDEHDGWDYWKIHVDDQSYHEGHGQAYKNYGIDPARGCSVVLRPDQYISWVGEFDEYDSMDSFFSGFMIDQRQGGGTTGTVQTAFNGVVEASKKMLYSATLPGTNGLRNGVQEIQTGDEAVTGLGGI